MATEITFHHSGIPESLKIHPQLYIMVHNAISDLRKQPRLDPYELQEAAERYIEKANEDRNKRVAENKKKWEEYDYLRDHFEEWVNDPDVIEGSKKDGNDDFWYTNKGFILERHHSYKEEWFEYGYIEPFVIKRMAEGIYSDPKNIDWKAEAEYFLQNSISEEDYSKAKKEFSLVHMDFRKYLNTELIGQIQWHYDQLISKK